MTTKEYEAIISTLLEKIDDLNFKLAIANYEVEGLKKELAEKKEENK